ncbi:hypothetical protein ACFV3R_09915 [Streptomyces sp. NPDC059740]|uniref:hypothetical protein n=1 Tax=Streptomyces sp. NPDC059740 TaxID=3346926 RepID=UPI003665E01A
MTYLVVEHGRVTSAHTTLALARAAEAQGPGHSNEAGPALGREPAWWYRGGHGDFPQLGLVRTEATALGLRFELRACQAPAGSCDHDPCAAYVTWASSSSYHLLGDLAMFVPASWVWAGMRGHDPRGDEPGFRAEAQALVERLTADLRPPLYPVGEAPIDPRPLEDRRAAAHGLVVRFLAAHFGPSPSRASAVEVHAVLADELVHLTFEPPAEERRAVCGVRLANRDDGHDLVDDTARRCKQCFGRAPISPPPVLTAAEHDAWTTVLRAQNPPRP